MKNIKDILRKLQSNGFIIKYKDGSLCKIFPPNRLQKFYSLHLDNTGKAFFPLNKFSKRNWNIDLNEL